MEQETVLELFDRYADMVYRIALSYLRSPQEAEDVVQTVFLKLLEGGMIVYPGKERAFLTKVTINHCKNLLTAAKKHEAIPLDEAVLLIQPEDRDIFYAVMELPEKYRAVVSLHYFEGYSFREISEFLHIGISAVSMRLHRAKNILKKQLGRDGYVFDFGRGNVDNTRFLHAVCTTFIGGCNTDAGNRRTERTKVAQANG